MPGMDGLQAAAIIRRGLASEQGSADHHVMVTAFGRDEVRDGSREIGIDAYLMKPVNTSVLYDT